MISGIGHSYLGIGSLIGIRSTVGVYSAEKDKTPTTLSRSLKGVGKVHTKLHEAVYSPASPVSMCTHAGCFSPSHV